MKNRFDSHIKFYRRREQEKEALREFYADTWQFYSEQLRQFTNAHPDWRTNTEYNFWANYGNW